MIELHVYRVLETSTTSYEFDQNVKIHGAKILALLGETTSTHSTTEDLLLATIGISGLRLTSSKPRLAAMPLVFMRKGIDDC